MLTTRSRPITTGYGRFDRGEFRWFYKADPARIVFEERLASCTTASKRDVRGLVSHKLPNRIGSLNAGFRTWSVVMYRRASSVSVLVGRRDRPATPRLCEGLQPGRHVSCRVDGKLRKWNWTEHQAVRWTD